MIDLHTHTTFSDGELIPSELARRAEAAGLTGIAITDHGDFSNLDFIIPRMVNVAAALNRACAIRVIAGIELTHVPPSQIAEAAAKARDLGARIVVVHGETLVEPVCTGTNRAAILAGVDVLAHPGLISEDEVKMARDSGVLLEISGRKGHSLSNGHVALLAKKTGAGLVIDSDGHAPGDIMTRDFALRVARGAGLAETDFENMQKAASRFLPL